MPLKDDGKKKPGQLLAAAVQVICDDFEGPLEHFCR